MNIKITKLEDSITPQVERLIGGLQTGLADVHRGMAEEFMAVTFSTFGAAGQNRPVYWPDLSPKYQKAIKYYGRPKLILTGALSTSINIIGMIANGAEVGTDVDYAETQQYGGRYVPPRPYFPVLGKTNPELTDYARARIETRIAHDLIRLGLG